MASVTPEQARLTLRRMAAYLRRHGEGSTNLRAWADFIEALPPDGDEALALTRGQRELGFPEEYEPRCDDGLYMRGYGLASTPPPNPGTLRELVALEGADEPLPAGAYFPMDRTPVRDGLPLWAVDVRVISDDVELFDRWQDVYDLSHPLLEKVRGYGFGETPDAGELYSTELQIWAADEAEACAIAGTLVDRLMGSANGRRRLQAEPAYSDEYFDLPRSPEDYEPRLVKTRWHHYQPSPEGAKIIWFTGPCPLERVDVEETPERVTVTLWERYPAAFAEGGTPIAIPAIGLIRSVDVRLEAPLNAREVIDGTTGRPPDDIDDFDYVQRNMRDQILAADSDADDSQRMP
jgi:hypothetical protein